MSLYKTFCEIMNKYDDGASRPALFSLLTSCIEKDYTPTKKNYFPKTDVPGVNHYTKTPSGKYQVNITLNRKQRYVGLFDSKEEASRVYKELTAIFEDDLEEYIVKNKIDQLKNKLKKKRAV